MKRTWLIGIVFLWLTGTGSLALLLANNPDYFWPIMAVSAVWGALCTIVAMKVIE